MHKYTIIEPFRAVEATAPPAEVQGRDAPALNEIVAVAMRPWAVARDYRAAMSSPPRRPHHGVARPNKTQSRANGFKAEYCCAN
jgi:hypothetical protein